MFPEQGDALQPHDIPKGLWTSSALIVQEDLKYIKMKTAAAPQQMVTPAALSRHTTLSPSDASDVTS
jgi:hypothetical protein